MGACSAKSFKKEANPKATAKLRDTTVVSLGSDFFKSPTNAKLWPRYFQSGIAFCEGEGGKVYYMVGTGAVKVLYVEDPFHPSLQRPLSASEAISEAFSERSGAAVVRQGNYLYVAGGLGIRVFDVSTPGCPTFVRTPPISLTATKETEAEDRDTETKELQGNPVAMTAHGSILFVAGANGLEVFSIKQHLDQANGLQAPTLTSQGSIEVPVVLAKEHEGFSRDRLEAFSLLVLPTISEAAVGGAFLSLPDGKNSVLFVAGSSELVAFDIKYPDVPSKLCSIKFQQVWVPIAMCLVNPTTMYATDGNFLWVVDVGHVHDKKLELIGDKLQLFDETRATHDPKILLAKSGKHVFVAGGAGLAIVNASPTKPTVDKAATAWAVDAVAGQSNVCPGLAEIGGMIYMSGGDGLIVLKHDF